MATRYFIDVQGRYYSSAGGATSPADSEVLNVSAAAAALITAQPATIASVHDAIIQAAGPDRWGKTAKLH